MQYFYHYSATIRKEDGWHGRDGPLETTAPINSADAYIAVRTHLQNEFGVKNQADLQINSLAFLHHTE